MPWVKGQSGNPGGRPRIVQGIRRKAQNDSEDAYAVLKKLMSCENEKTALSAAISVLKIAGVPMSEDKAPDAPEPQPTPAREMTPEQLEAIAAGGES